jgi:hypothetical protein
VLFPGEAQEIEQQVGETLKCEGRDQDQGKAKPVLSDGL